MVPIEYSKRIICAYKDYGCGETSCPLNIGHKPKKLFFTILDIPSDKCLYTKDMVSDNSINYVIRSWIKETAIEKKRTPIPYEITKFFKRKCVKIVKPFSIFGRIEDKNGGVVIKFSL